MIVLLLTAQLSEIKLPIVLGRTSPTGNSEPLRPEFLFYLLIIELASKLSSPIAHRLYVNLFQNLNICTSL